MATVQETDNSSKNSNKDQARQHSNDYIQVTESFRFWIIINNTTSWIQPISDIS